MGVIGERGGEWMWMREFVAESRGVVEKEGLGLGDKI